MYVFIIRLYSLCTCKLLLYEQIDKARGEKEKKRDMREIDREKEVDMKEIKREK